MKTFSILSASLMFFAAAFAMEVVEDIPTPPENKPLKNHLQVAPDPAVYPLTLIDGDKIKQISIMDRESLPITCTLKNISDKPVLITRIATTCSCISLKTYTDITLKPAETLLVEMTIFGHLVKKNNDGFFRKEVVVFTDQYDATFATVEGHVKTMLSFEPAQAIDLGEFIGDVPTWKRTITINTLFEQDGLSLKPTADNSFFNITTANQGKGSFEVTITPKTPFPINSIKETILLEVVGLPNYAPIPIFIIGHPKGLFFTLVSHGYTVIKSRVNLETPTTFTTQMTLTALHNRALNHSFIRRPRPTSKLKSAILPVSKEENETRPLDNPDSWKRFIPDLSVQRLPNGVKVDFTPAEMGIDITFTLDPTFLNSDKPSFNALFLYKNRRIGFFDVNVL